MARRNGLLLHGGPTVRLSFPPAASHVRTCPPRADCPPAVSTRPAGRTARVKKAIRACEVPSPKANFPRKSSRGTHRTRLASTLFVYTDPRDLFLPSTASRQADFLTFCCPQCVQLSPSASAGIFEQV